MEIKMTLSPYELRRACIKNNWCNACTNAQYEKVLSLCAGYSISKHLLIELCREIARYTDGYSMYDDECVNNIACYLLNDHITYFVESSRN